MTCCPENDRTPKTKEERRGERKGGEKRGREEKRWEGSEERRERKMFLETMIKSITLKLEEKSVFRKAFLCNKHLNF